MCALRTFIPSLPCEKSQIHSSSANEPKNKLLRIRGFRENNQHHRGMATKLNTPDLLQRMMLVRERLLHKQILS